MFQVSIDSDTNGVIDFNEFCCMMVDGLGQEAQTAIGAVVASIQGWFDLFDHDRSGSVSFCELFTTMRSLGLKPTREQVTGLMRPVTQADGTQQEAVGHQHKHDMCLHFAAFARTMLGAQMSQGDDSQQLLLLSQIAEYKDAFSLFDCDQKGYCYWDEWKDGVRSLRLGPGIDPLELATLLNPEEITGLEEPEPKQIVVRLASFVKAMKPDDALEAPLVALQHRLVECRENFLLFE